MSTELLSVTIPAETTAKHLDCWIC